MKKSKLSLAYFQTNTDTPTEVDQLKTKYESALHQTRVVDLCRNHCPKYV